MMVEYEKLCGSERWIEGSYWLEVFPTSEMMFAYHHCPNATDLMGHADGKGSLSQRGTYDCLLTREVEDQNCLYCGKIEMPESLQAMWHLFNMKGNVT
jgi:hypothetical protein